MPFRLLFWRRPRINVVEMHGLIAPRPGAVSMGTMAPLIDRAFRSARGRPVILDIESPGGSPVQSDLIASLIRRRADEHKVRVHAVIREVGASGGYWLACAADEIHANPMSIVGSIGVRGGGFGFPDMLTRDLASSGGSTPRGPTRRGSIRSVRKSRRTSRSCRNCWTRCTSASSRGCGRGAAGG